MADPTDTAAAWPEACRSMDDMTGWRKVSCDTRDRFFRHYQDRVKVYSSLTDPEGQYGEATIYTEWGSKDGDKPWLRDYRYPNKTYPPKCVHWMPEANIAW